MSIKVTIKQKSGAVPIRDLKAGEAGVFLDGSGVVLRHDDGALSINTESGRTCNLATNLSPAVLPANITIIAEVPCSRS